MAPTTGADGVAWTRGAGLVQHKIFGQLSAAQTRTLIFAVGALGALSHATGVAFALPTTIAEWWPKALEALPQLSVAWGAHHILRQLLQLAWGAQLSYVRLRITGSEDVHNLAVAVAGGQQAVPPGYLACPERRPAPASATAPAAPTARPTLSAGWPRGAGPRWAGSCHCRTARP
jgi:hypothetical protein